MVIVDRKLPKYLEVKNILKATAIREEDGYKLPTLAELKKKHKTSLITISRAIRELVNEGYLETIQGNGTFASKLYKKDSLVKFRNIGLVFANQFNLTSPWIVEVMRDATATAKCYDYNIVVVLEEKDHLFGAHGENLTEKIENGYYAGFLLGSPVAVNDLNQLLQFGVSFVSIGTAYLDKEISYVIGDTFNIYKMLNYCIKKGRKNILCFVGPRENAFYNHFFGSYRTCMEQNNLRFQQDNFVTTNWTEAEAYQAVLNRFSKGENRPDAIVTEDGTLSNGAHSALRELKIKVPEDVIIVQGSDTFPNIALKKIVPYFDLGIGKMAQTAAGLLIKLIEGEEVPERKIVIEGSVREPDKLT